MMINFGNFGISEQIYASYYRILKSIAARKNVMNFFSRIYSLVNFERMNITSTNGHIQDWKFIILPSLKILSRP